MSIWRVFSSTVAAFFGVQTEQNRQKDFQTQSPLPFIIMGIILAIALVISLMLIVNQVLS
ncbi:DUF2970 domain-containing protein [Shewanella frigidimarina]|jgi:hypothetical protein|uniref:DUF2970 domain-containing protein n=1 Tax=Shewanella frigidimarina (strain NCIMB 400) TaxID=318167 RepID=Q088S3_SHEFN|nr:MULTISPECIES: DUF2970 domain-containing protein [Shewanella]ABI70242.1 conserved hypothetical protein [Shewanella frigidimarina NCIMB 400]MBB1441279.1 DUF2970 domain-containing protein [Shewanella sp. SG41-4]PKI03247.1 DUF2970 domain-containing protein [Shewanella sp. 11B5]RPA31965.1 DUF2970 domain-containing protein [Shewanella frigidimarina]RPA58724.1 DUF2970 domain-containing protein [Shewanella frigidimarina]|tara:strand:- start:1593 stop:1772 length:180 start_codon:yes stop_codon:yes gene_type:complete